MQIITQSKEGAEKVENRSDPRANLILGEQIRNRIDKDEAEGCVWGAQYFLALLPIGPPEVVEAGFDS